MARREGRTSTLDHVHETGPEHIKLVNLMLPTIRVAHAGALAAGRPAETIGLAWVDLAHAPRFTTPAELSALRAQRPDLNLLVLPRARLVGAIGRECGYCVDAYLAQARQHPTALYVRLGPLAFSVGLGPEEVARG